MILDVHREEASSGNWLVGDWTLNTLRAVPALLKGGILNGHISHVLKQQGRQQPEPHGPL